MKRLRKRLLAPSLLFLEARRLLSGTPAAVWIGQDGHDFAGGATPGIGNGVQDVHVVLSNLPVNHAVSSVVLLGFGGGGWNINSGPYSSVYSGYMTRAVGSTVADLYLDPYVPETGRHFDVVVNYDDQSSVVVGMDGGKADPNLWMPGHGVSAQWVGQDGSDLTGPTPGVGPDGIQDVHMTLGNLLSGTAVTGVSVVEATGHGWAFGLNPTLLDNAEFVLNSADASKGDLYFSPDSDLCRAGAQRDGDVRGRQDQRYDGDGGSHRPEPGHAGPGPCVGDLGHVPRAMAWTGWIDARRSRRRTPRSQQSARGPHGGLGHAQRSGGDRLGVHAARLRGGAARPVSASTRVSGGGRRDQGGPRFSAGP